jgi:hypothetical protein
MSAYLCLRVAATTGGLRPPWEVAGGGLFPMAVCLNAAFSERRDLEKRLFHLAKFLEFG